MKNRPPFTFADEDVKGNTKDEPADLQLTAPAADQGGTAAPVKRRGAPRGPRKKTVDQPEPAAVEPVEVDQEFVDIFESGLLQINMQAEKHLEWTDPGDKWRETMARLSAKMYQEAMKNKNPTFGLLVFHAAIYVLPNAGASIINRLEKRKEKERASLAAIQGQVPK